MSYYKIESYSETSQTSQMKVAAKIVNALKQLNISAKISNLDVWLGSKSASVKAEEKHKFIFFW